MGTEAQVEYDDLLPVCLHKGSDGYWLLDRHNDSVAKFEPALEIEDMERIVALINRQDERNEVCRNLGCQENNR